MADDLERRIRDKAHQLWEQEGRPEGRAADHWEKARILVAIEDDQTSLVAVAPEPVEEAKIQENLGEFPTASTDEGDRHQTPSRKAERSVAETATNRLRRAFSSRRK